MNWSDWVLVGWLLLGAVSVVSVVGKPRKPLAPEVAAWVVIFNAALIAMILFTH